MTGGVCNPPYLCNIGFRTSAVRPGLDADDLAIGHVQAEEDELSIHFLLRPTLTLLTSQIQTVITSAFNTNHVSITIKATHPAVALDT